MDNKKIFEAINFDNVDKLKYDLHFLEKQVLETETKLSYFIKELGFDKYNKIIEKYEKKAVAK